MNTAENPGAASSKAIENGLPPGPAFLSLFLVSSFLIAFETALSRYFAITTGSEYGYLIISIVMVGLSLSGVLLSLFENFFRRFRQPFLFLIPVLLFAATLLGMFLISGNHFNPLELQHEVLWKSQLLNIFKFYLELTPVFFLAGLFFGLNFVAFSSRISQVYACNLLGSAFGSLLVLGLMFVVHPFYLLAAILPLLFLPALLSVTIYYRRWSKTKSVLAIVLIIAALAAMETVALKNRFGKFPYFKPIYSSLNISDNRVVKEKFSPAGYYIVLDNISEFDGIDLSNNYASLNSGAAPRSYGIYKDGGRILSLMKQKPQDFSYLAGALDSFPYRLKPRPKVLLIGTAGGFRVAETLSFEPSRLVALEPDEQVFALIKADPAAADLFSNPVLKFTSSSPFSFLAGNSEKFDLIDLSSDLLFQNANGVFFFTVEALESYLAALEPGGVVSVQIPISEFSIYALKMFETIRAALLKSGVSDPAQNIMVYRSAWTAQFLVSRQPFDQAQIEQLKKFCYDRSFDTSYYPGIDPKKVEIWNDLPAVSFTDESESTSEQAHDSLMMDMLDLLHKGSDKVAFFDLAPSTLDMPNFFSALRLKNIRQIFARLSIIPQEEIGNIINLIVLGQALVFALLILLLPLLRRRRIPSRKLFFRAALYFAGLGLAFLFIEIALINWFSFFLNDYTASFALVLTAMLICSGIGSWFSSRHLNRPRAGLRTPIAIIIVMLILYMLFLPKVLNLAIDLPLGLKGLVVVILVLPISFAMGHFFPLGLSSLGENKGFLLPWAWAVNGAFSVISTPLANLLALRYGFFSVFALSALLYLLAFFAFPNPEPNLIHR